MNYVLAGLESDGYIERHTGASATARIVRLTEKGWDVIANIRGCVAKIEEEWAAYLGVQRFNTLRDTLRDLSAWLGKLA